MLGLFIHLNLIVALVINGILSFGDVIWVKIVNNTTKKMGLKVCKVELWIHIANSSLRNLCMN